MPQETSPGYDGPRNSLDFLSICLSLVYLFHFRKKDHEKDDGTLLGKLQDIIICKTTGKETLSCIHSSGPYYLLKSNHLIKEFNRQHIGKAYSLGVGCQCIRCNPLHLGDHSIH